MQLYKARDLRVRVNRCSAWYGNTFRNEGLSQELAS